MTLRGRKQQCGNLDTVAADARAGRTRRLVACGDPAIGKAARGYATIPVPGHRAAPAEDVQADMDLPVPAPRQASREMLDRLDWPPDPQAPEMVFGLRRGSAPIRFLLGTEIRSSCSSRRAD